MDFLSVVITSLLSFAALFAMTKLSGNKQISELTMYDYIISISIGSIAAELATELERPLLGLTALLIYGTLSFGISYLTSKSIKLRRIIFGHSVVLVYKGKFIRKNFERCHIDLNEFMVQCRTSGYFDISAINTAVLEPSGKISILPYPANRPATPADLKITAEAEEIFYNVIMDGKIMEQNLRQAGFDKNWLIAELKSRSNVKLSDIFLGVLDENGTLHIYKGDHSPDKNDYFE